MELLAGLDLGTSAFKGVLVDRSGRILGSARREREYCRSASGRVEEEPASFKDKLFSIVEELASVAEGGGEITAIACASASGDSIFLDADTEPIGPIRSWMDRRAVGEIDSLLPGLNLKDIHRRDGWPWDPRFPRAQLAWLRARDPESFGRLARVATDADYAAWLLSGEWGIDVSSAASLYLFDQARGAWHEPYLESVGIASGALSPLFPSGTALGALRPELAALGGIASSCQLRLGAFDHACAARGAGILREGDLLLSCGTSWVMAFPVADRGKAIEAGMLVDSFLNPSGPWLALLDMGELGGEIDRRRKDEGLLGGREPHAAFESAAASAPPLSGSGARAMMEGAAFAARRSLVFLEDRGYRFDRILMAGGPASSRTWARILAAVLGRKIELAAGQYTGAIGAAIIAGLAGGLFADEAEAAAFAPPGDSIYPDPSWVGTYAAVLD
jgi:sugar (pentulose or hexulose) kinase